MEDAHTCVDHVVGLPSCSLFAVFDGHSGKQVSAECASSVRTTFEVAVEEGRGETNPGATRRLSRALADTFQRCAYWHTQSAVYSNRSRPSASTQRMDSVMQELYIASNGCAMNAGSTANACLVTPTHFICGNAGDTRCVLFTGGAPVPLSTDHKPTLDAERKRIQKAGGIVSGGRVNGCLAVSRAMGDFVSGVC